MNVETGKDPNPGPAARRRGLAIAALAVAAIVAGLLFWNRDTRDEVHFLSGLPFPVTVTMGGREFAVEPGVRATHEFEAGEYHVVARRTDGGALVEEFDSVVSGDMDLVACNVLGSAPLYLQVIAFTADDVPDDELASHESLESLAGRSWVTVKDVDYVFVEPPEEIDISRALRVSTRSRAAIGGAGTWIEAAEHLASDDRMADAAALARRVALVEPSDDLTLDLAYRSTLELGEEATTRAFFDALLAAAGDEIQPHRMYQEHMKQQGASAELRARYKAAYEDDPTSARAGYLYARIAPHAEALPIYESLLPANPEDTWLLRGASWTYFQLGRFREAALVLESYLALDSTEAGRLVPRLARALAGAGRPRDALETVDALLSVQGHGGANPWTLMALYASLRRLVPDAPFPPVAERWKPLLEGEPGPVVLAETAALARDAGTVEGLRASLDDAEVQLYCDMVLLSRHDVGRAAELALEAAPETLERMDDAAKVAIACELARAGRRERSLQVLGVVVPQTAENLGMDDVDALPDIAGLSQDLDIGLRAVLLVAASRRTDDAARKAELLAEARRFDVLRQVVPD